MPAAKRCPHARRADDGVRAGIFQILFRQSPTTKTTSARLVPCRCCWRGARSSATRTSSPPRVEMLRDPLYAHLNSYGLRWFAAVGFFAGPALWGFSIQRTIGEGAFDEYEKTALADLSQRLTETATLSTSVGRVVLSNVTNALAFIKRPAIALDRFGSVLDVNPVAEVIFGGDDINLVGQRLVIRDKRAQSAFNAFLDRLRTATDLRCACCRADRDPARREAADRHACSPGRWRGAQPVSRRPGHSDLLRPRRRRGRAARRCSARHSS